MEDAIEFSIGDMVGIEPSLFMSMLSGSIYDYDNKVELRLLRGVVIDHVGANAYKIRWEEHGSAIQRQVARMLNGRWNNCELISRNIENKTNFFVLV